MYQVLRMLVDDSMAEASGVGLVVFWAEKSVRQPEQALSFCAYLENITAHPSKQRHRDYAEDDNHETWSLGNSYSDEPRPGLIQVQRRRRFNFFSFQESLNTQKAES